MKKYYIFKSYRNQKGLSVAIILASIVVLGVLGYIGSSIFTSIIGGNQRANLVIQSGQSLTQASFLLTTEATKNGSGIPVALAYAAGSPAPTGGGIIPTTSAAPKIDSFGTNIGYCTNNAVNQNDPVFAIISAGSNRVFDTTCVQALAGTKINDDKIMVKSVGNILQGVGGTVYFGDPVAAVADLATLSAVKPGQLRTVLADGSVWVNKTGAAGASSWTQAGSVSGGSGGTAGGGPTVMYLEGMPSWSGAPASCPTDWTEVDYKINNYVGGGYQVYKRTCTSPLPFIVMYLDGMPDWSATPGSCPAGWTQANYHVTNYVDPGYKVWTRTCFKAATPSSSGGGSSGPNVSCVVADTYSSSVGPYMSIGLNETAYQWKTVGYYTWTAYSTNTANLGAKNPPNSNFYGTAATCTNPSYPYKMERQTIKCTSSNGVLNVVTVSTDNFCFNSSYVYG